MVSERVRHSIASRTFICYIGVLLANAGADAQSASGKYASAAVCGGCHRSQFIGQSASAHAKALFAAEKHPLRDQFLQQPARRGPYEYTFLQNPALQIRIRDAKDEMVLPLEWAFGAGQAGGYVRDPG